MFQQIEPMTCTVLQLGLKTVVGEKASRQRFFDGVEALDRTALRQRGAGRGAGRAGLIAGCGYRAGNRLIQVGEHLQVLRHARLRRRPQTRLKDQAAPLNRQMIALHVAGGQVLRDVACLCIQVAGSRYVGWAGESCWVALDRIAEARIRVGGVEGCLRLCRGAEGKRSLTSNNAAVCELRSLRNVRVHDVGQVIDEQVLAAFAVELSIVDAVALREPPTSER